MIFTHLQACNGSLSCSCFVFIRYQCLLQLGLGIVLLFFNEGKVALQEAVGIPQLAPLLLGRIHCLLQALNPWQLGLCLHDHQCMIRRCMSLSVWSCAVCLMPSIPLQLSHDHQRMKVLQLHKSMDACHQTLNPLQLPQDPPDYQSL